MSELDQQEEQLFDAAQQLSDPHQRAAFLDAACTGNPELRKRLDELLIVQDDADSFFDRPPIPQFDPKQLIPSDLALSSSPQTETAGDRIGRYKLLEKLGEGGFGEVWMAEQREPVKRRVALKIIKLGMDTKQVIARFEAERQALALMDHPNIAKVLDGGATDNGRPYFVMELVRGIRITDYCEKNRVSTRERLELFVKVCQAIQHAHQKGVIHRDIKPANILVTLHDGTPVPKVIDFGIAKATQQDLTDKTVFTQFHQFIGTPAYMSPEQAEMSGFDVDTRSDIYSLGVLLYESLVGKTPFDAKELMASGLDVMRQTIREKEPVRPSTRITHDLDAQRNGHAAERRELVGLLRGDLDWIVMKCLEKDRSRRYETANGIATDIKRHLNNEPVVARPPSAIYRFQKLARRHKVAIATAMAVLAALVIGAVVSTFLAIRAIRAEREQTLQTKLAQANELKARNAQASEARERAIAESARQNELRLRQDAETRAYAADMTLAQRAIAMNNLGRALELLNRHKPFGEAASQTDRRRWEWRYLWQYCQNNALCTLTQRSNSINSIAINNDETLVAIGERGNGGISIWNMVTRAEAFHISAGEGEVIVAFSPREPLLAYSSVTGEGVSRRFNVTVCSTITQQIIRQFAMGEMCQQLLVSSDGEQLVAIGRAAQPKVYAWNIHERGKSSEYPLLAFRNTPGTPVSVTRDIRLAAQPVGGFGKDGELRVINLPTGTELWRARIGDTYIASTAFSPDGKTLAVSEGTGKTTIHIFDVETGREAGLLEGHRAYVLGLEFSADGKLLASGGTDQTVRLWDVERRKLLATLHGHGLEVWRVAMMSRSGKLVSGSKDGAVMLWNSDLTSSHQESGPVSISQAVNAWCFSSDSRTVRTLEKDGVYNWSGPNFEKKELVVSITPPPSQNPTRLFSKFSPDGELVAVRQNGGFVSVWDLSQKTLIRKIQFPGGPLVPWLFTAKGKKLLVAQLEQSAISEWDLSTGLETGSWNVPSHTTGGAFYPDEYWSTALGFGTNSPLRELVRAGRTNQSDNCAPTDAMAISPGGRLLATQGQFDCLNLWETAPLRHLHAFNSVLMGNQSVGFSPDGSRLIAGSNGEEAIKFWDVESLEEVLTIPVANDSVKFVSLGFSPDGNLLGAWNRQGGSVYVWRAPSWEEIAAAEANAKSIPNSEHQVP